MADLGGQAASGGARGELTFNGREKAFDLGALAVRFFRKGSEHLIPNGTVGDTPAPRGNAALRSQALPKVLVIGFHPHPPAAHRGERLVPPHPAIPAERASRTQALNGLAAPAKSVAAHSPQSATSTKDCLERRNSIRPSVPSHLAYKAERGGNELFKSGTETARPRCICQHEVERA